MDGTEDDERCPQNTYGINHGYRSSQRAKLSVWNASYPRHDGNQYVEDDDNLEVKEEEEEEEEEEEDDYDNVENGIQQNGRCDDDDDEDDDEEEEGDDDVTNDYSRRIESIDQNRHQKKRKMKSLLSSYEFAPRVAAPSTVAISMPKPSYGGRSSLSDWTEHETLILLDAWGDRFLQRGRKSLRSEEWQEVAGKVSQESKLDRSDVQCRNRLDTLKKKYKKEKMKLEGIVGPENSEPEENGSDFLPPKRTNRGDGASFRLLADSIQKFSDIYEKIESSKRQQMLELEKMRMNFHRELEMQKTQMLERTQTEIAKIRQGDDEENDVSAENVCG